MTLCMPRRYFLRALATSIAAFVLRPFSPGSSSAAAPRELMVRLSALFADQNSAAAIGRAYLCAAAPEGKDAAAMIQALCSSSITRGQLLLLSDQDLLESFRMQAREDFAENRTVKIDGWILSETEARLCALVALAASDKTPQLT